MNRACRIEGPNNMSEIKLSPIERIFVTANRVFGVAALSGGLLLLGTFAFALIRGRAFGDAWWVGALGLGLGVVGFAYLKAPLTRWHNK